MGARLGIATNINSNTTTQVKTGSGILKRIVINDIGSGNTINVYNAISGTTNLVATIKPTVTGTLEFNCWMRIGIRIINSGGTSANFTVVWE